jgi:hypothetical protein
MRRASLASGQSKVSTARGSPPIRSRRTRSVKSSSRRARLRRHRRPLQPRSPARRRVETFLRREDAERFVEEVRGDDPELAANLRIEERELEASARN